MGFVDLRTYNQYDLWKNQGKSYNWLKGYKAGFMGNSTLPNTASAEYKEGYLMGYKDWQRESLPPSIKDGFSYGHGFKPDALD